MSSRFVVDIDDLIETDGDEEKAIDPQESVPRRAMIALFPESSVAAGLALVPTIAESAAGVAYESPEDLHVTLAYYPLVAPEDRDVLLARAARLTEYTGPPQSRIEGVGTFLAEDERPHVLLLDPTSLCNLHDALCMSSGPMVPMPAMDHGYIPHITLAYAPVGVDVAIPPIPTMTLTFPRVSVVYDNGERHDFAFNGLSSPQVAAYRAFSQKQAIGSHSTATDDTSWDGATAVARLRSDGDAAYYRREYAWQDPDGDPNTKAAYKFPHHSVSADGTIGAANTAACSAGIAVLNGGRGGANIPDSDRQGIYNHLARHLRDGDREPPELKEKDVQAQTKEGRRLQGGWLKRLGDAAAELKRILAWAGYEEGNEESEGDKVKAILSTLDASGGAFLVFKDATGQDRWLAFSSNGFEDREHEIVATDALERAVALADADAYPRGPLRLFHVEAPLADIGDCDWQAMEGRFLIESGTFRDTEIAQRALSYFRSTDDLLGVSIGFAYPKAGGFTDGIYREIQIIERSVCPHSSVANPYTSFQALSQSPEEGAMNRVKQSWLERVLGGDAAAQIISQAQDTTKALEGAVAFKQIKDSGDPDPDMEKALAALKTEVGKGTPELKDAFAAFVKSIAEPDDGSEPEDKAKETTEVTDVVTPAAPTSTSVSDGDFVTAITAKVGEMLAPINDAINRTGQELSALSDRVKAVEDIEQARKDNLPAGAGSAWYRATAADANVIDAERAQRELGTNNQVISPVQGYIDMLKGRSS